MAVPERMVVVVAVAPRESSATQSALAELGALHSRLVDASPTRRLVVADVADEWMADRVVRALRADGQIAVSRPTGGVRLDAWMRHTEPVTIGDRLTLCPAWSEHDRTGLPGVIELGLGGFGSGQHPTTRLIIEELQSRVVGGERVLDLGCGSGVLGLCAVALGASRVVGLDIKADAVAATLRNAELNGMADRVESACMPLAAIDDEFDVIVANVGRAVIVEVATELVDRLAPRGWLAVSGISPSQCSQVADFLRPLREVARRSSGEWPVLVLAGAAGSAVKAATATFRA